MAAPIAPNHLKDRVILKNNYNCRLASSVSAIMIYLSLPTGLKMSRCLMNIFTLNLFQEMGKNILDG